MVTEQEMRSVVHQKGLQHRGVHVFLFNEQGEMLIQKRSADRANSPSLLDCSVSEHVKAGENYLEAAARGLKEEMGVERMLKREEELLKIVFDRLAKQPKIHVLAGEHQHRLGVIAFYIDGIHYNLAARILNDRFGIQVRSGCACAGTYGHYLLHINQDVSMSIFREIARGNLTHKPGWVRMSIHPTMSDEEVTYIMDAMDALMVHVQEWEIDYRYDAQSNEYIHRTYKDPCREMVDSWMTDLFEVPAPV